MKMYSFTNEGKTWARVTKKQAMKAYNSGLTILLCPVKMRPFTSWHLEIYVDKSSGCPFNDTVSGFEYYNCNSDTGMYTAFYIKFEGGAAV